MTDPDMTDLVQRCLDLLPTLTSLNRPENDTTVLIIFGVELLLHAIALAMVLRYTGAMLMWMVEKGVGLLWKGWRWHQQKRTGG